MQIDTFPNTSVWGGCLVYIRPLWSFGDIDRVLYWAGSGSAAVVHWAVCLPLPWCYWLALQCYLELHWIISNMYHFCQASLYLGNLCINMISRFLFMISEVSCGKVICLDVWTDHITTSRNTANFKIMSHSICVNHLSMF